MKKLLLIFLLTLVIIRIAEAKSCIDLVNKNETDFGEIIAETKENINNIELNTNEKENLLKEINKYSNMNKCIQLRNSRHPEIYSYSRYEALYKLNSIYSSLTTEEKSIYNTSIKDNKKYFSAYSDVSLIDENSCDYPLVYLLAQDTDEGIYIHEARLLSNKKIKSYSGYLPQDDYLITSSSFKCGKDAKVKIKHSKFLNNKNGVSINVDFQSKESSPYIPQPTTSANKKPQKTNVYLSNNLQTAENLNSIEGITVVKDELKAVDYISGDNKIIKKGSVVVFDEKKNNEVFFFFEEDENRKYRTTKYTWENNTEQY